MTLDCNMDLFIGRSWAFPHEIYDVRQYVHVPGQPLKDADIKAIAFEAIPTAASQYFVNSQCLQITDPKMEDQGWTDVFGNSCDWCKSCKEVCACLAQPPPATTPLECFIALIV